MAARAFRAVLLAAAVAAMVLLCPAALAVDPPAALVSPQQQQHLHALLASIGQEAAFHANGKIHFVFSKASGFRGAFACRPPVRCFADRLLLLPGGSSTAANAATVALRTGVLRAPLQEKELLFSIPREFLLASPKSHWSAQLPPRGTGGGAGGGGDDDPFPALDDSDRLVLRLLEECGKGSASRWVDYIALLPADVGA
jgi:hypothetical protein